MKHKFKQVDKQQRLQQDLSLHFEVVIAQHWKSLIVLKTEQFELLFIHMSRARWGKFCPLLLLGQICPFVYTMILAAL